MTTPGSSSIIRRNIANRETTNTWENVKNRQSMFRRVRTARSVDPLCTEFPQHRKQGATWTTKTEIRCRLGGCLISLFKYWARLDGCRLIQPSKTNFPLATYLVRPNGRVIFHMTIGSISPSCNELPPPLKSDCLSLEYCDSDFPDDGGIF